MLEVQWRLAPLGDFAARRSFPLFPSSPVSSDSLAYPRSLPTLFSHYPSDMRAPLLWLALAVPAFAAHDSLLGSSHDLVARAVQAKDIAISGTSNRTVTKGKTGECTQAYIDNKKTAYCKQSCPPNQWPLYRSSCAPRLQLPRLRLTPSSCRGRLCLPRSEHPARRCLRAQV